jgi:hypothetical protein
MTTCAPPPLFTAPRVILKPGSYRYVSYVCKGPISLRLSNRLLAVPGCGVSRIACREQLAQDNRREVNFAGTATRLKIVPVASWADIRCEYRSPPPGSGFWTDCRSFLLCHRTSETEEGTNTVRGGSYVEIYQRQSQAYLYRSIGTTPPLQPLAP